MSCPISTMGATGPTARSTSSFYEFRARSLDPVAPGLRFLWGCNAANPLIARKWRYGFPCSECRWDRNKGSSQIRRHSMHHTGGDFFLDHKVNVAIPRHPRPPDSPKAGAGLAAGHRSPAVKLNLACFKFSARKPEPVAQLPGAITALARPCRTRPISPAWRRSCSPTCRSWFPGWTWPPPWPGRSPTHAWPACSASAS